MSQKNKRPLSTAELLVIFDEDEDLLQTDTVDAVYILPHVDEVTNEEKFDDDICDNQMLQELMKYMQVYLICLKTIDHYRQQKLVKKIH